MSSDKSYDQPLPYGWIQETDHNSGRPFWVDTHASPPRSIWVHPYEDELFLKEHPDIREKVGDGPATSHHQYQPSSAPPPSHSAAAGASTSNAKGKGHEDGKRGFLGKIKDKAIGTKEEREAERRQMAQIQEQRRQAYAQQMASQGTHHQRMGGDMPMGGGIMGGPMGGGIMGGPMGGGMMGGPMGGGMMSGPMGGGMMGGGRRRQGGGMGGMALPLAGGLAGGMLLGSMMDNDHGDYGGGGDYGGDDYGGGGDDFGGGDF